MSDAVPGFWDAVDRLVEEAAVVIDRPAGSRHPRFPEIVYPLDYGFLDGTTAVDGGGVDVWRGTLADPAATAVICTVDLLKRDTEAKLLLGCTPAEIELVGRFHNAGTVMKGVLIRR